MAAARKMDELLVSWLGSDAVYESILEVIENYRKAEQAKGQQQLQSTTASTASITEETATTTPEDQDSEASPRNVIIPPFYPRSKNGEPHQRRRRTPPRQYDRWEPLDGNAGDGEGVAAAAATAETPATPAGTLAIESSADVLCVRDQAQAIFMEIGQDPPLTSPSSAQSDDEDEQETDAAERLGRKYIPVESFVRITKDVCRFPSFFNAPLYQRILLLWNEQNEATPMEVVTFDMLEWYWKLEMEPYDASDRFFRLVKQPSATAIARDDFLPFITQLLNDHPGLEFLSSHAEFQDKYAVTVITRIFYSVNRCHSGRITSRQIRRSDLLESFHQVDEEEDINKVTRYFSYEHFYVLYCRFWELDHDRDYRINREDLLKYGDHSLSHMIVDRIFDAAPRPFETENPNHDFLSYESFIYFMLSEEDKSNEVSVRYWFSCVDVDGDGKLNNMEMRSFYAVQLHRMQCMGQEIVPFEDMLCQMMDMIKPKHSDFFIVEDFLQPECSQVSGALFDALFNLNKYLMFEQRDPFVERQKREDEFECDWDRFACIDYNRLAMEEEAREEEAMEIDWVTVDEDGDGAGVAGGAVGAGGAAVAGAGTFAGQAGVDPVGAVNEAPF